MIHFLVGPGGTFTRWCEDLIAAAIGRQCATTDILRAATMRELGMAMLRSRGRSALVTLDQMPGGLCSALRESARKVVVVQDDPLLCLFEQMQKDGADLAAAVRALASSHANLSACMALPNALVLRPPAAAAKAASLFEHLGLDPIPVTPPARSPGDLAGWWKGLGIEAQTLIAGAFNPASQSPPVFDWAPALFLAEDNPSKPATGPIDITGRGRCLLSGPNILLPSGLWRVTVRLAFSETAAGQAFQLELSAGAILAVENLCPLTAGEKDVAFEFSIGDSGPVSVRLLLHRAAFDGAVRLLGVRASGITETANALSLGRRAALRLVPLH
jgi:hypothetical protein